MPDINLDEELLEGVFSERIKEVKRKLAAKIRDSLSHDMYSKFMKNFEAYRALF